MSLIYKFGRVSRLRRLLGLRAALAFEAAWTLRRPRLQVQVPGYRNPFVVRRDGSDLSVFEQVFLAEDCHVPLMASVRTVVDGGANVGFTTAWFAERYPTATVLAVEPSGASCELLRENTRGYSNVKVLQSGLWSRRTSLRVKNPDALPWSYQVEECAAGTPDSFDAVSVPDLLALTSDGTIDLLKLDVEGAERVLFSAGVDAWIDRVRTLVIELHGPEADAIVRGAMRGRAFSETSRGEKVIFQRAQRPCAVAAA